MCRTHKLMCHVRWAARPAPARCTLTPPRHRGGPPPIRPRSRGRHSNPGRALGGSEGRRGRDAPADPGGMVWVRGRTSQDGLDGAGPAQDGPGLGPNGSRMVPKRAEMGLKWPRTGQNSSEGTGWVRTAWRLGRRVGREEVRGHGRVAETAEGGRSPAASRVGGRDGGAGVGKKAGAEPRD
jgi:hypothetical protein